jgi:hypothetical protein
MKSDNQWHDAILAKTKSGNFVIGETFEEIERDHKNELPEKVEYQDVKFNYNKGQPLVDLGGEIVSIVDLTKNKNHAKP